uniref:Probable periplasmic serine endoprotease DegP-like n=1 Tax=Desulfobacca acetoxidans TaxID=60893 RepID=A0A7C5EKZ1_9BACT
MKHLQALKGKSCLLLIAILGLALFAGHLTPAAAAPAPASFADIAEKYSKAVVNISTQTVLKSREGRREFFGPGPFPGPKDPFWDFFEKFFPDIPRERTQRSLGTGFIIDPKGLVITNDHVVKNADKIKVKLAGGKEYTATIKGRDPQTDIALLQIDAKETFPYLSLGDSDAIRVGDWVIAIGNPFGLGHTVTQGIISAKGRVIGAGRYDNFLQTDAAINPGNSGGPLLNLNGEVVGINTAIVATGQGIGFAIPSNLAKSVVRQLQEKGKVVRGMLGVQVQTVTPEMAKAFGLDEPKGALVAEVHPDTPAQKAGIQREDIIIEFNGHPIHEMNELPRLVAETPPGTTATVKVLRGGKEKTFTVTVAELKEERFARGETRDTEDGGTIGLVVEDLDPQLARRFGLRDTKGVVVVNVLPNSPASEAGLQRGDLILEINGQPVPNTKALKSVIAKLPKKSFARFLVKRENRTHFFAVEIPE